MYNLNIVKVSDLGLIDSTNEYISYKSIDSLITTSDLLLVYLKKVNKIQYSKNSNEDFIIVFDRSIYKNKKPSPSVYDINPSIFLNSINYNFLTIGLEFKLSIIPSLLQRIIAGGGTTFSTPNYHSVNFGYGVGLDILEANYNVQVWMNWTESILFSLHESEKFCREEMTQYFINGVTFFSLNENNNLYLGIGLTYHLNQFTIKEGSIPFSVQTGLKFSFYNEK